MPADASLDDLLAPLGRMNFVQDCAVDGRPARLTMNETAVFLAAADADQAVRSARFDAVRVAGTGTGTVRVVELDGQPHAVDFGSDDEVTRFRRVLGVRKDGLVVRPTAEASAEQSSDLRRANQTRQMSARDRYQAWSLWAMFASAVLLVVGWLDLAVGVVFAFYLIANDSAKAGVVAFVIAVAGCAMPLCVAALTRMVVYRYRAQDEVGHRPG